MDIDAVFDKLRAARWNLISGDFETRVAGFYACEDAAAELSALVASTDPRVL